MLLLVTHIMIVYCKGILTITHYKLMVLTSKSGITFIADIHLKNKNQSILSDIWIHLIKKILQKNSILQTNIIYFLAMTIFIPHLLVI